MAWVLYKSRPGGIGLLFGQPIQYMLKNDHGFWVAVSMPHIHNYIFEVVLETGWYQLPRHVGDTWLSLQDIHDYMILSEVSKLEALVVLGLHDGNAEDIGKNDAVSKMRSAD